MQNTIKKWDKSKRLGAMHKRETELLASFLSRSKVAWADVPDAPHNTINVGRVVAETVVVCFRAVASVTVFNTFADASWFTEKCIECCFVEHEECVCELRGTTYGRQRRPTDEQRGWKPRLRQRREQQRQVRNALCFKSS